MFLNFKKNTEYFVVNSKRKLYEQYNFIISVRFNVLVSKIMDLYFLCFDFNFFSFCNFCYFFNSTFIVVFSDSTVILELWSNQCTIQ